MKYNDKYTIQFPKEAMKVVEEMAEEDGTHPIELVRRAINFYEIKLDAKRNGKLLYLEKDGKREVVML